MSQPNISAAELCPCASKVQYQYCCQPLHLTQAIATSPEQLMRSRYCAFVVGKFDYLIATHHPDFRQGLTVEQLATDCPQWLGLHITKVSPFDTTGDVTFKAWYIANKHIDAIYEMSSFVQLNGHWLYTTGKQMQARLPNRNEPCICHSGKKFKHCCATLTS
ncbi:YchJ family protein [Shewanella sp.]|uniref:YchJ family protein n=1 Tax=Shewanella sp. TaxID=50422 RepID=UPI0040485850